MNRLKLNIFRALRRMCLICGNVFAAWLYIAIALYVLLPTVPHIHANALLTYRTASCVYIGRSGFVAYGYYRDCPFLRLINPDRAMPYER